MRVNTRSVKKVKMFLITLNKLGLNYKNIYERSWVAGVSDITLE